MRLFLATLCLLFLALPAWSAPLQQPEQLKSAIIINLARYIDWPDDSFAAENAPFGICSMGKGRLGLFLKDLHDSSVKGHPVTVRSINSSNDLNGCHLVVVLTDDRSKVTELLDKSRRQPILTVGELSGFSRDGGIVELFMEGNRIRFRINVGAARTNRLSISTHLLKLAHDVIR